MNTVMLELDSGPVELTFAFAAIGYPGFSDIEPRGPWVDTYEAAEREGAARLAVGNWRSFRVEKRYWPVERSEQGDNE